MKSIPFFLVTGFLGSGKTTLLERFIKLFADKKRIAVIQNEFAPGQVAGLELSRTGKSFEILEINRGSVFCVCLISDFVKLLHELIHTRPVDAIILEATGLADPIAVGQLLEARNLKDRVHLAHVWCVVDVVNFQKLSQNMTRIIHQVQVADTVIINKTDLSNTELPEIKEKIKSLNPFAKIYETSYCDVSFKNKFTEYDAQAASRDYINGGNIQSGPRPNLNSVVYRDTKSINRENFENFIKIIEKKVYRLKGFVKLENNSLIAVQSCFGITITENIENISGQTEFIAIGPGIDHKQFRDLLNSN
ncbi:GTP-binding protein [candidate division KSB1 bacterium]|nr:GTP-binding protein [candidate division KSB1 bacterium]